MSSDEIGGYHAWKSHFPRHGRAVKPGLRLATRCWANDERFKDCNAMICIYMVIRVRLYSMPAREVRGESPSRAKSPPRASAPLATREPGPRHLLTKIPTVEDAAN